MHRGAVADAALVQVQHLAGEAVPDAVNALARTDKAPLLPFGIGIVPQLNAGAVVGVIISHFHDFAVGGADGVELVFLDHSLRNFLCCHLDTPPERSFTCFGCRTNTKRFTRGISPAPCPRPEPEAPLRFVPQYTLSSQMIGRQLPSLCAIINIFCQYVKFYAPARPLNGKLYKKCRDGGNHPGNIPAFITNFLQNCRCTACNSGPSGR